MVQGKVVQAKVVPNAHETAKQEVLDATLQLIAAVYRPPQQALKEDLLSGCLEELLQRLAEVLELESPQLYPPEWRAIETAYVALFSSNPAGLPAPPYACYAKDNELLGKGIAALGAFYAQQGLRLSDSWHDLPDHIAAVAEAGLLLTQAGRDERALELARRFLLPWFKRFAPKVAARDESGFYGPITSFLHICLQSLGGER